LIASPAATASAKTTIVSVRTSSTGWAVSVDAMTSCFHSRSECSRANSFEIASNPPIRFTATRNASFSERPAPRSAATSPRR
jgi:hypothetical protein